MCVASFVLSVNNISMPSLSHLCHLIFIPIKPLFHISFLSLMLPPPIIFSHLCFSVSYSFCIYSWSPSLWFPFSSIQYLFHLTLFSFLLLFSTYIMYFTQVMQKGRRIWANKLLKLLVYAFIPPKSKNSTKWLTLSGTFLKLCPGINWQSGDRYIYPAGLLK